MCVEIWSDCDQVWVLLAVTRGQSCRMCVEIWSDCCQVWSDCCQVWFLWTVTRNSPAGCVLRSGQTVVRSGQTVVRSGSSGL